METTPPSDTITLSSGHQAQIVYTITADGIMIASLLFVIVILLFVQIFLKLVHREQ